MTCNLLPFLFPDLCYLRFRSPALQAGERDVYKAQGNVPGTGAPVGSALKELHKMRSFKVWYHPCRVNGHSLPVSPISAIHALNISFEVLFSPKDTSPSKIPRGCPSLAPGADWARGPG